MLVIDVTVHAHFKQIITEIEIHPFANIGTLRRALLAKVHDLVGSHVVVDLRTGTDVPDIIGITEEVVNVKKLKYFFSPIAVLNISPVQASQLPLIFIGMVVRRPEASS